MPGQTNTRNFDWKSMLSVVAVITSLSALYVSWNQMKLSMAAQQASVFPYLTMAFNTTESSVELFVSNDGNGPAFISGVEVKMGDSTYADFNTPIIRFLDTLQAAQHPSYVKSDLLSGWVIRPNDSHRMIFKIDSLTEETRLKFWRFFDNARTGVRGKIWYYDLYNNCWEFDAHRQRVVRSEKCPNEVLHR